MIVVDFGLLAQSEIDMIYDEYVIKIDGGLMSC